jgi:hypothetical protein
VRRRARAGFAIYLVGVVAMLLFGLGAVLSFRSAFTISTQRRIRQSLEARYLAEAGLQRALHLMRHGHVRLADSFEYGGGKVALKFQPGVGPFGEPLIDVLSRGTFLELSTVLLAKVELDPAFLMPDAPTAGTAPPTTPPASDLDLGSGNPQARPSAGKGLHVTLVKYVATIPEELAGSLELPKASEMLVSRIKKANSRYAEALSGISRAELRWNLFGLAAAAAAGQAGPGVTAPPSTTGTRTRP